MIFCILYTTYIIYIYIDIRHLLPMIHWSLVLLLQLYEQQTVRPQWLQFLKTANAEKGSGHVDFAGPIGRLPCNKYDNNAFQFYKRRRRYSIIYVLYSVQYNNNSNNYSTIVVCMPRDTRKSDATLIIGTDFATIDFGDFSYLPRSEVQANANTNTIHIHIKYVIITISDSPSTNG